VIHASQQLEGCGPRSKRRPIAIPSLKATAIMPMDGDFAARLERAVERSHPGMIETKPVPVPQQEE